MKNPHLGEDSNVNTPAHNQENVMDRRVSTDKKTTFFNQKEEQDDQDDDNLKDQVDLKDIKADFQKT